MTSPYGTLADTELVTGARDGDTRAFDELVRRYRDKVYRLSFKILRNEDDAAEALQDALEGVVQGRVVGLHDLQTGAGSKLVLQEP